MKKVLSTVLAVLIAAGSVTAAMISPLSAVSGFANAETAWRENAIAPLADVVEEGMCGENLTWVLDSEGTLTISGTGAMNRYNGINPSPWDYETNIKSVLIKDGVTSIGYNAFWGCSSLTNVTIPDSVTSIGYNAFWGCSSLTNVTIPDSVTSIDEGTFDGCSSLTSVTIPDSVTRIGNYAFYGCSSLTNVTIPDSVTSIGYWAFSYCSSLTSVTIPDNVTSIGEYAFCRCSSLEKIEVGSQNENYSSVDGMLFNKDQTEFICYPAGKKDTTYEIPDSVTSIGKGTFYDCSSLASVTIPDSVTCIGYDAFSGCSSLTSVTIPDGVTSIGNSTFYDCSSLVSVTIPNSVTSIGNGVFDYCTSLESVTFNGTRAEWNAIEISWNNDPLTSTEITCTDGIIRPPLANGTCGENLTWVLDSEGTLTIRGTGDMYDYYVFPNLGIEAEIKSVVIKDGVTSVGSMAFFGCTSLTTVTIPDSVTSVDNSVFHGCTSLTAIDVDANNAYFSSENGVLFNKDKTRLIQYPAGKTNASYTIPDSVTSIDDGAFGYCTSLTAIDVDAKNAYYSSADGVLFNKYRTELILYPVGRKDTSYEIPDSVKIISNSAFSGCSSLESVIISNSVTSIGSSAFSGCSSLESVIIGNSVTSIGGNAFSGCSSLESVIIGNNVTSIGSHAFYRCYSLTSVTIPDSVTSIGALAFSFCRSLTSVTIPDGVTSISDDVFCGCFLLTSVTIPDSVTSIGDSAFDGCTSLESVTFKGTIAEWDEIEIDNHNEFLKCAEIICIDGIKAPENSKVIVRVHYNVEDTTGWNVWWHDSSDIVTNWSFPFVDGVAEFVTYNIDTTQFTIAKGWIDRDAVFHSIDATKVVDGVVNVYMTVGSSSITYDPTEDLETGDSFIKGDLEYTVLDDGTLEVSCPSDKKDTLIEVIIPSEVNGKSVTSIGEDAFRDCSSLESVTIHDGVTSIGKSAFESCSSLTSVTIPDSVISVDSSAFANCSSLTSVAIPDSVTSIGGNAFRNCSSLTSVAIPNSVTWITAYTFQSCSSLTSVTIPNSVTSIGTGAFDDCNSLTSVTFNGTMAEWNAIEIRSGNENLTNAQITCTDGIINERKTEVTIPVEIKTPETGAPDTSDMTVAISGGEFSETLSISENGTVEFGDISDGEYTFTFSAKNCAPRAYDVTVSNGAVSGLDDGVELHLYGDIDGDGKVNMKDVGKANAHAKNTAKLSDYDLSVCDINGDGKINMQDVGLMNAHAKNTKSLW